MLFSYKLLRVFLVMATLFGTSTVLSACNTMEGLGEDTQSLGSEIEEESEQAQ